MNLISSLLPFVFGKALKFPLITGLLLFSLMGMGYSYWKGRSDVHTAYKAEKVEAIEKDAKENQKLKDAAHKDELEHQTTIAKSQSRLEKETDEIKSLEPSQCLDVKLSDIGLR
jgi:hypothetical protein